MTHTPYPETRVNTYTSGGQFPTAVTSLDDGGWVVTWSGEGEDDGNGVYQRVFHANGLAAGDQARVNTFFLGDQNYQTIITLADGGWVVTWNSDGQDGSGLGVFQQAFHADGSVMGGETRVNASKTYDEDLEKTAALADGGWVVTWEAHDRDGNVTGLFQQAYNTDGTPMGVETRIDTLTTDVNPRFSGFAALKGGGWVVSWQCDGQDGDFEGVFQQAYHADGTPMGSETQVNTWTTDDQDIPVMTALNGGGWVVTWESKAQDGSGEGVYQQVYRPSGTAMGAETRVNTHTLGNQGGQRIAALANGGWVVTWGSDGQNSYGLYQQVYNADGTPRGGETQVNTYAAIQASHAKVTVLVNGGWVVSWDSFGQDGDGWGVYQQAYNADGTAMGSETMVNTYTSDNQELQTVTALAHGGWLVAWISVGEDGEYGGVYQQRYNAQGQIFGTNRAPDAADRTITELVNGGYSFSKGSFGFTDGRDGDHLASVLISVLPTEGKLLLNGGAVTKGQTIDAADLSNLVWQAGRHALNGTLKFEVKDDGGIEAGGRDTSALHTLTFAIKTDIFTGTKEADKLVGTDGHDIVIGKAGNDRLTGGEGADTFRFKTGDGKDWIADFHDSQGDKIDLTAVEGITSYKDLMDSHLFEHRGSLRIVDGDGDEIVLRDTSEAEMHRADFLL